MHLLLDIWFAPGGPWADRLQALLLAIPGVRRVRVFPDVGQAEVELGEPSSALPEAVVVYLEGAGYGVRASPVPPPDEPSAYARYFHATPESSESRWVD